MGVTVSLPLFGDPGRELEIGKPARSKDLRDLADALRERLLRAADALDRLTADGWSAAVGAFDLILAHRQVETREAAERRLRAVGLDPEELMIVEDVEDEDEAG
jgi:hypothetical protein